MQLPLAKVHHHRMLHVLPLLLGLVVGELVSPFPEPVIAPVILEFVVAHSAAHGRRRSRRPIGVVAAIVIGCRVFRFDHRIGYQVCDEWWLA